MRQRLSRFALGLLGLLLFAALFLAADFVMRATHLGLFARYMILLPVELVLYIAVVRVVERRSVTELAPRACAPQTISGFVIGTALFSCAIVVLVAAGDYHVLRTSPIGVVVAPLAFWISAAISEELIFRGFVFRIVQDLAGTWIALVVSAALFGLAHAMNPGSTLWSSLAIALEAGVLLGLAYALTQRLWLPIGIHIGWNFAEGTLYGTPVSGGNVVAGSFLHATLHGPVTLTGGAFGIEASAEALAITLVASLILVALVIRKHRVVHAFTA